MEDGSHPRISWRQFAVYLAVACLLWLAEPEPGPYVLGCAAGLLGLLLRVWGCGHLRKNQEVVTSGPYAHVKNPLYVGTFLLAVGGFVAAGAPRMPALLLWIAGLPLFLLLWFGYYLPKKARVEGARLRRYFGPAYERYERAVPAFVPSLRRYPGASRARWDWTTFRDNHELGLDLLLVLAFAAMPCARALVPAP